MADNEINVPVNIPDEEPELEVTIEAGEVAQVPLDESLTVHGMGADAKAVGERMRAAESNIEGLLASDAEKVQRPATNPNGTDGQLLRTHGDGNTEWVDEGLPTDEQTGAAVSAWLNEHPEATTTVQDGSITFVKLHSELQNIIGGLQNLSDAQQASIALMLAAMEGMVNGGFVENNALYLTHDGVVVAGPFEGIGGGGSGGGDSNTAKMSMTNGMEWLSTTIRKDAALPVTVNWSSTLDDIPTGNGSLKVQVNGTIKTILNVTQGAVTVDIGPYMSAGNNTVRLTISDAYGNTRSIVYTVNSVQIAISSSFDAAAAYNDVISFPYTPVGAVEKTVHFKLDGAEIGTVTTTISNRQLSYAIPAQDHGGHSLEVWFTAQINGETVESNRLYYEFVALEDGNDTPIIISGFAADEVTQYDTVNIPFQVYDPAGMEAEVEIYEGDTLKTTVTVGRAGTSYTYRADKAGSASVKFKTGETVKTVSFNVTALNIDVHAETEGLLLHLNAQGRRLAAFIRTGNHFTGISDFKGFHGVFFNSVDIEGNVNFLCTFPCVGENDSDMVIVQIGPDKESVEKLFLIILILHITVLEGFNPGDDVAAGNIVPDTVLGDGQLRGEGAFLCADLFQHFLNSRMDDALPDRFQSVVLLLTKGGELFFQHDNFVCLLMFLQVSNDAVCQPFDHFRLAYQLFQFDRYLLFRKFSGNLLFVASRSIGTVSLAGVVIMQLSMLSGTGNTNHRAFTFTAE